MFGVSYKQMLLVGLIACALSATQRVITGKLPGVK